MTEEEFDEHLRRAHGTRWLMISAWIVAFTIITFFALRSVRNDSASIADLRATNADLQKTNCGLEKFLLTARIVRWQAYEAKHQPRDLQAVKGYESLLIPFVQNRRATGVCPIPSNLQIKQRPLGTGVVTRPG